jgi:hypothetical protein
MPSCQDVQRGPLLVPSGPEIPAPPYEPLPNAHSAIRGITGRWGAPRDGQSEYDHLMVTPRASGSLGAALPAAAPTLTF